MRCFQYGTYELCISDKNDLPNLELSQKYLITMPRQTHSSQILMCQTLWWYHDIHADGLVSDQVCIGVAGSDCNLVAMMWTRRYLVCHAGWRGLTQAIIEHSLDCLLWLWENTDDLSIVLGPSIRSCCFQIWEELVWCFGTHTVQIDGYYYADMIGYMREIFAHYGIPDDHIIDHGSCTKCHPDLWRSYRNGDRLNQALWISKTKNHDRKK